MRKAFFSLTKILEGIHTGSIVSQDLNQGLFCMERSRERTFLPTDLGGWAANMGIREERADELHRHVLSMLHAAEDDGRIIYAGSGISLTYGLFDFLLVYVWRRGIFSHPFLKANKQGIMNPVRRWHQIDFVTLGEMLAASGFPITIVR
jgi:hypothetical protein